MNRLVSHSPSPPAPVIPDSKPLGHLERAVRETSLLRLAQSIEQLNPELARSLCRSGLAAMKDPVERETWHARLAPWLDDDGQDDEGGGLVMAGA